MKKYENDDLFINTFLWSPSAIYFIIFIYKVYMKGSIGMIEWQTLLGAFIGAVIAGGVAIWKENKNSKGIMEKVQERHTTQKAEEYHELTMKEFDSNKERILDAKEEIKDISSSVNGISTDIKLMSKDIENHVLNLKEVRIQEPNLIEALKIIEGYVQRLGKAERIIQELAKENEKLTSQLNGQIALNNELNKELGKVKRKLNHDRDLSL